MKECNRSREYNLSKDSYEDGILPRQEMMETEFKTVLRIMKSGSGRLNVPKSVATNYLPGQLVQVSIKGTIGPVVIL